VQAEDTAAAAVAGAAGDLPPGATPAGDDAADLEYEPGDDDVVVDAV
jgi:hypothetical protein